MERYDRVAPVGYLDVIARMADEIGAGLDRARARL
jgi:hypothetical protein